MRLLVCLATVGISVWAAIGYAQESKKELPKAEVVKATFLAKGLH
jgi:hypothetical protein